MKTGILVLVLHEEIENPDLEIESQLNTYLGLNNLHIITEEKLEDLKIIEIVLDKANQYNNGDPDDLNKEQLKILISERLIGLNKFIGFFKQQIDEKFKAENLKIFQKYLAL
ncbi:1957_t:CDS:2, partial [Cetraspora pellucida]